MAEAKELRKACSQALLKPATSYDDLHGLLFQMQRNLKLTFEREAEDVESETDIIDWDPSTTGLATTTTSRTRHSSLSIVQRKEDIRRAFRAMKKAEQVIQGLMRKPLDAWRTLVYSGAIQSPGWDVSHCMLHLQI